MLTVGVDLAASPLQTAACWIKWASEKAEAYKFRKSLDDEELIESFQGVDKVGLDVPLGCPTSSFRPSLPTRIAPGGPTARGGRCASGQPTSLSRSGPAAGR